MNDLTPSEKFEIWAKARHLDLTLDAAGYYATSETYHAYEAFNAAVVWCRSGKTERCFRGNFAWGSQDCEAPYCGCNPAWKDAMEMLQEIGWKSPDELEDKA